MLSKHSFCGRTVWGANRKFGDEMLIPRKAQLLLASTLALTMLLPSLGSPIAMAGLGTAVVLDPARKIHPMLQAGAALDPTSLERAIVQNRKPDIKSGSFLSDERGRHLAGECECIPTFVGTAPPEPQFA